MKNKLFISAGLLLLLGILSPVLASSNSDAAFFSAFLGGYAALLIAYYCFICLAFLAMVLHGILSVLCILDIMKRDESELNREMWVAAIIVPGTMPFISWFGGVFVSVGVEIYYLMVKRNKLS